MPEMTQTTRDWLERGKRTMVQNYARQPIVMVRGEGAHVWDADGNKYLDLFAGFGGGILGHCHPELVAAATGQAKTLWHVGNTFYTPPQIELAERLNRHAFAGQAFFCHSGAEANEAACKLARLRGNARNPHRWKMLSLTHSFHGRTLAMIAATGNPAVRQGFEPDVPGFEQVEAGDFHALHKAVDEHVGGIIMEPIQGEGGVNFYPAGYVQRVRRLCDEKGLTLIFDEVWTGCGRTGKWFGHQHYLDDAGKVIEPDIMTLGKAVGGGLPMGIMYARPAVAALLGPGKHGCTLGGNAICAAVSRTIFDVIERDGLTDRAATLGEQTIARLKSDSSIRNKIAGVRGKGIFIGIELKDAPEHFMEKALARGIIINLTAKKVIRLAPPINIEEPLWNEGLDKTVQLIASL
ncbi:MAG TPA: acetylornithine/succinylornithine family transaminase [Tepidisphaeraceae bacterium]|nr:acetylornithine/succinylornithine family transaminase [Tepidisphaeraceae bacterium]